MNLSRELDSQGVSRKVSADMFGLALRSYRRRIQRLAQSSTERNRSLWEAVLDYLAGGELKSRRDVLKRFCRDDETSVRAVLHDLCESGLVLRLGSESNTVYRAATPEELAQISDEASDKKHRNKSKAMSTKHSVSSIGTWLQVAGVCAAFSGCVTAKESSESETHFLECETNADCVDEGESFICYGRRCRDSATLDAAVPNDDTTAEQGSEYAADDTQVETDADDSETDEPPVECSGPGRYERGKAPGPPGCCEGLHEEYLLAAYENEGGERGCEEPGGHVIFICVEGQCGDGTCEVGENVPCGCVEDCPDAAWEPVAEGNAEADASFPARVDAGTSTPGLDASDGGQASDACSGVGSECTGDAQCQAFDPGLSCLQDYCLPTGVQACGGAAGTGCETAPFLTCVTLVGDFGVCLDSADAACFCAGDAGLSCAVYPTPSHENTSSEG